MTWGVGVARADQWRVGVGSLDDVIGSQEEGLRDGEAQHLRCLQIDGQLELCRLLDGEVRGFGALEDLVNMDSSVTVET